MIQLVDADPGRVIDVAELECLCLQTCVLERQGRERIRRARAMIGKPITVALILSELPRQRIAPTGSAQRSLMHPSQTAASQ